MTPTIEAVWTTTSHHLNCFNQPLLKLLRQQVTTAQWQYQQTEDEPCSLDIAVSLLHKFILTCEHPIHLIGHGTGGLVSLLYARQCPQKVKSLTLLGVGANASWDWIAHFYYYLQFLHSNRHQLLTQLVSNLFGKQNPSINYYLAHLLEMDMGVSPSPHSLFHRHHFQPSGVSVPMLVCGCENDPVVSSQSLKAWESWMKGDDRLWQCQDGHHFFHSFYPKPVANEILDFWEISTHPLSTVSLSTCSV
ncbi:alpha/beta hydrolase [Acaryochloris sp. IP29b_bin.137]|uniref:alpha/beta fold hydrolase n=1 Tax=Acaryochloris sp. IP29b_bin.137 TaxID=2969217 RepID=UPI002637CD41|nr:alpha/beta hydrolase [Acaryochloris sp. IP29b_bin.137]